MIYRLFLSFVIVALCYVCGRNYSMKFIVREKNIGIMCNCLRQLLFNIQFLNMPLSQSFFNISKNEKNAVGEMFEYIGKGMCESKSDICNLWKNALDFYKDELMFREEEIQILIDFVKRLGTGDRNNEISNIECTVLRLKSMEEEALNEKVGNVKMFRGMGLLAGIFIVIMLL